MHKTSLRDYNILSIVVYKTDPKKGAAYIVGKNVKFPNSSQSYEILDISRGTYGPHHKYGATNGMQTMTVAPVDKKWQG